MRRALVLFIALLLPLQLAWGAMGAYCRHETGAAGEHLGHHAHVHHADGAKAADPGQWGQDSDCGTCHAVALAALTTVPDARLPVLASAAPVEVPTHWRSAPPPDNPERPKWTRLA